MQLQHWAVAAGTALAMLAVTAPDSQAKAAPPELSRATAVGPPARVDVTSAAERKRTDSLPKPRLDWYKCYGYAECATVRLPLDYDSPKGPSTEIAVLRIKARKPAQRIGSLFVNPGGPGGSGTEIALWAPTFLGASVLDRFDVVGFDPRGMHASSRLKCFRSTKDQTRALAGMDRPFPVKPAEEKAYIASAKALGRACSATGKQMAGAMSTAQVARDMDVLRRALGDRKLTYLGFSYGTALGQYYANMFPDRVRAIAVDGVINPVNWVGTATTGGQILDDRLRSADGAYLALRTLLVRCGRAGQTYCMFADGDPVAKFDTLIRRLKAKPVIADLNEDGRTEPVTYADFVNAILTLLYDPDGANALTWITKLLYDLSSPVASASATRLAAPRRDLARVVRGLRARAPGRDFPYDNGYESYSGVLCTDGHHPADAASWPALTARADRRAPYFGRAWAWSSVQCASRSWTVRDEDAYLGPFNRRTSAPVLFVGNYYDPATNYAEAVSASRLVPNSRLLSSDSWGHTAYGTSRCVTGAVDAYLVRGALPAPGARCVGDTQPFTEPHTPDSQEPDEAAARMRPQPSTGIHSAQEALAANGSQQLPPIIVPDRPSTLLGTR
jgi:pimeloyl-ACP methyl ester carboxylesterase